MTQEEAMALPPDELAERNATVCLPCPKCGNIIKSFTVAPTNHSGDTTVVNALCDQCQWSDEAAVPTDDLGLTSLALPKLPAPPPPNRLDAAIAPSAAEAGESVLDKPIFLDKPAGPPLVKPTSSPDLAGPLAASAEDAEEDTGALMLEDVAGTPPQSSAPKRPTALYAPKFEPVVRRISTATRQRQRQRQRSKRSKLEAWVLTVACFVALASGGLELLFLAHRMTTPQIILVSVFLVPVLVFLVDGLKGLWRDTRPA